MTVDEAFEHGLVMEVMDASDGGLLVLDHDGRVLMLNAEAEAFYGIPRERLLGRRFFETVGEAKGAPEVERAVAQVLAGGGRRRLEFASRMRPGVFIEMRLYPIARGVVARFHDVTDRVGDVERLRLSEVAARRNEDRLQLATATAGLGVFEWDLVEDRPTWEDERMYALFGRSRESGPIGSAELMTLLHPDDRSLLEHGAAALLKPDGAVNFAARVRRGDGAWRWLEVAAQATFGANGRPERLIGVVRDITEPRETESALRESEERLRLAVEGTNVGAWDLDLATGTGVWPDSTFRLFGLQPPADRQGGVWMWSDRLHPEDRAQVLAERDQAILNCGPYHLEYRIRRADTGEVRWLAQYGTVVCRDGLPARTVGVVFDRTAEREAVEREKLLLREVDHRAKNVLAVVQSILRLTPPTEPKSFAAAVQGRVAAIARSHTLLARERWASAPLPEMLAAELGAAAEEGRVTLEGPPVGLTGAAAQPFGMVLHELASNALRHGALSRPEGRLTVTWSLAGSRFRFGWIESAGPPVFEPERPGFGLTLMRQLLERQLNGEIACSWGPDGLEIALELPRDAVVCSSADGCCALDGMRVLVAEDHMTRELRRAVEQCGGVVVGPAASVADAIRLIDGERLDAAVLDVKLSGQPVTPAARALEARGVPFVYAADGDGRPAELPPGPEVRKPCSSAELTKKVLAAVEA